MVTALFTHPACLEHDAGPGHPERPDRLRAVLRALEHPDFVTLLREEAPLATLEQLGLVHPPAYLEALLQLDPGEDLIALDADTLVGAGSLPAALRAAGGAIAAVDAVMDGWATTAFAAVRPPGHHAEPARAMGFCLLSNAAVAAMHARQRWGLSRVAVVDFDVHHGNGTQAAFAADPGLFYASSHQSPCYPGTGAASERGVGNLVNLPLPPGSGSVEFRAAWERHGLPELRAFGAELVIVSAGFDAHKADPLAQLRLEADDFGWVTEQLMQAAGHRLVSVLEGGYDLRALALSTAVHVRTLMRH